VFTSRNGELLDIYDKQPYSIEIENLQLIVDKDVFPPDLGLATKYVAKEIKRYRPKYALDMGCGTGFVAFVMKSMGVEKVYAIDIHPPAVACARKNLELNLHLRPIEILQGDLFEPLIKENIKFDLIVFNQPYYPIEETIFGMGADGGRAIVERFFNQVRNFLAPNACIVMPFSDMAADCNNPLHVALSCGFSACCLLELTDRYHHYVYEFKLVNSN
jgi:release factor glutamine methyltransferase